MFFILYRFVIKNQKNINTVLGSHYDRTFFERMNTDTQMPKAYFRNDKKNTVSRSINIH
jgi:hypothetical protein